MSKVPVLSPNWVELHPHPVEQGGAQVGQRLVGLRSRCGGRGQLSRPSTTTSARCRPSPTGGPAPARPPDGRGAVGPSSRWRTPSMAATCAWAIPGRGRAGPWAGVARLEMPSGIGRAGAVDAADQAAGWLPGFASALHRDARAPVNLTPIAGLEQHLHRRQGAARLALRAAPRGSPLRRPARVRGRLAVLLGRDRRGHGLAVLNGGRGRRRRRIPGRPRRAARRRIRRCRPRAHRAGRPASPR